MNLFARRQLIGAKQVLRVSQIQKFEFGIPTASSMTSAFLQTKFYVYLLFDMHPNTALKRSLHPFAVILR